MTGVCGGIWHSPMLGVQSWDLARSSCDLKTLASQAESSVWPLWEHFHGIVSLPGMPLWEHFHPSRDVNLCLLFQFVQLNPDGKKAILQWAVCPFPPLMTHFSHLFQLLNGSHANPQPLFPFCFHSGGTQLPAGLKPRLHVLSFLVAGLDRTLCGKAEI